MAADRAQHAAEVVAPALDAGRDVVSDRFAGSSVAYQGYGRGLPTDEVRQLSGWASGGLWPDLVVLLEVPVAVAGQRLGRELDRFELEGDEFHRRVADGFRALADADPRHWEVVDGTGTMDEVEQRVRVAVAQRLQLES